MNLVKCSNGHYYDGDKFDKCPHCAGLNAGSNMQDTDNTVDMDYINRIPPTPETIPTEPTGPLTGVKLTEDIEMTIGIGSYYNDAKNIKVEPVVGWMVCIEGGDFGLSFNLKAGKNFIGRSSTANDIVLRGDQSISREKHAIIVYDPKSRTFLAQPGTSSELFYVNNEVILQATVIKDRDIIAMGNSKLMFVPCCGPDFSWEDMR